MAEKRMIDWLYLAVIGIMLAGMVGTCLASLFRAKQPNYVLNANSTRFAL